MHVAARARLVLARRPWIYWLVVAALAGVAALTVYGQMASIATARDRWGTTRTVLVASRSHEPGDPIDAEPVALPLAALPEGTLEKIPHGAVVRQRLAIGEVLTDLDLSSRTGPAALAEPGTIVVAVSDPLARSVDAGLAVKVSADGVLLAEAAMVTGVVDDVVFVAVNERDGPIVAAAAQQGIASLLYVP
ncbi:MAG TPA: hypothetical protein VMY16_14760 [Ilumatobacteraceae bacterium]|nr:hypothetical protein [Ilumatobacteraceae bacterium]